MWRFPGNNYTNETGLDTSDMETFKKDPISSLARELCQNSIDARLDSNNPVIVEFSMFNIKSKEIPGKIRLLEEIKSCKQEWASHNKISSQLLEMEKSISKDEVVCLRVSDYNTKGLEGVGSDKKTSWYLLTKGSGISDKSGTTGGSKGIGKFATFVASEFNTVFYSTLTIDNEVGYQGICKLCSTSIKGSDEKTQGIGYYGIDDRNNPVLSPFTLEPHFDRKEPGTDIYIVGFRQENSWIKDIITKVLDSFMSAVLRNHLVVKIQDIVLSSETLKDIISNEDYILKSSRKDIIAQYTLLTDEINVHKEILEIDGYGSVELYVKGYSKEEINMATNSCVMIRYPYMKITTKNNISSIPCSAICIIGNNKLNQILRDIENPQHTDWEIKRIHDSAIKSEVKRIIKSLNNQISGVISDYLSSSDNTFSDIEGASDYLPQMGDNSKGNEKTIIAETPRLLKPKRVKEVDIIGYVENDSSESLQPEIGSLGEGDDSPMPYGSNDGSGGTPHNSDDVGGLNNGDNDVLRYVQLVGLKYRFFVLDKTAGKYAVVFDAPFDEKQCEMKLFYIDEGGNKYPIKIYRAIVNNINYEVVNNSIVPFELYSNKKYLFELYTDQDELFACEVRIDAIR